jgi:hypothetical protein
MLITLRGVICKIEKLVMRSACSILVARLDAKRLLWKTRRTYGDTIEINTIVQECELDRTALGQSISELSLTW